MVRMIFFYPKSQPASMINTLPTDKRLKQILFQIETGIVLPYVLRPITYTAFLLKSFK